MNQGVTWQAQAKMPLKLLEGAKQLLMHKAAISKQCDPMSCGQESTNLIEHRLIGFKTEPFVLRWRMARHARGIARPRYTRQARISTKGVRAVVSRAIKRRWSTGQPESAAWITGRYHWAGTIAG